MKKIFLSFIISMATTSAFGNIPQLECYKAAVEQKISPMAKKYWIRLCSGAKSTAPLDCYLEGRNRFKNKEKGFNYLGLNANFLVSLCQRATSNAPIECFKEIWDNPETYKGRTLKQTVLLCKE